MAGKLTPKQAAFVREYLVDLNAAAAARRAGYSPRTADRMGYENLRKPEIAAAIADAQAARAIRTEITSDRVLNELAKVAFSNLLDYFKITGDGDPQIDLRDLTPDQSAALAELQVDDFVEGRGEDARDIRRIKIKTLDKLRALDLLGKHLGMFTDKVDVTSAGEKLGAIVQVYLPENGRTTGE